MIPMCDLKKKGLVTATKIKLLNVFFIYSYAYRTLPT